MKKCENRCPGTARYLLINGEIGEYLCAECFAEDVVDLLDHNELVTFQCEPNTEEQVKIFKLL